MRLTPHSFTLRQLQYVLAVADELSFRRAAVRCHVSQPSLSAQLAQMERGLGVQLFERDRRRVLITGAGQEVVARIRALLIAADDLQEAGRLGGEPMSGTVRLGVIPTISPYLLPAVAPRLRATLPRLTVAWHEAKTADLVAALHAGELDAVLLALEAEVGDVEREVIAEDPFLLAAPRQHPLARNSTALDLSELRGVDVLLLDDGHCFRDQALYVCSAARAREVEYRATSLATLVQMVASGAGVTLLPALSVATEAKRAGLRVRPIASTKARRTIGLIWRRHAPRTPALRAVAEVLRAAFPVTRKLDGRARRPPR